MSGGRDPGGLTLLIGGARSGKSVLATRLASRWPGPVVALVTGEARDEEMAERIARHRAARPPAWETVEEPVELESALAGLPGEAGVVLDCLTLWVSNAMERGMEDPEIEERAQKAAALVAARGRPAVVVTNEVGSGIVPANPEARRYRDLLGRVNAIWADAADRVLLVVAGRVTELQGVDG